MEEQLKKQLQEAQIVIDHLHDRITRLQIIASNSASKVIELEYALDSARKRIQGLIEEGNTDDVRS